MTLLKLDVLTLRNIQRAQLLPSPSINFITGPNASGKSALLEAIFILGRARSYRTASIRQAIAFDHSDFIVSAQLQQSGKNLQQVGIKVGLKQCDIHIDKESKSRSDLAYCLPIQLIHPKSYLLLDGGPQFRREFMDWGVFNQKANYLNVWRNFSKILKQRNALLKSRRLQQIEVWNKEFVEYGTKLAEYRRQYIEQLETVFWPVIQHFLSIDDLQLRYNKGWRSDVELITQLRHDLDKDIRYGFTTSGPHRSDFQILYKNRNVKDFISRGQMKLLVLSLKLAQVRLHNEISSNSTCILIDDLSAELDTFNRLKLVKYLTGLNCQVFITSTELSDFGDLTQFQNYKVFHVEHGCIKSL
jgi:DNA replication and repair protein RecF